MRTAAFELRPDLNVPPQQVIEPEKLQQDVGEEEVEKNLSYRDRMLAARRGMHGPGSRRGVELHKIDVPPSAIAHVTEDESSPAADKNAVTNTENEVAPVKQLPWRMFREGGIVAYEDGA